MALKITETFVGATQRLDNFVNSQCRSYDVRVSYKDAEGDRQVVHICPSGARLLAKALRQSADMADPPKPRKKKA